MSGMLVMSLYGVAVLAALLLLATAVAAGGAAAWIATPVPREVLGGRVDPGVIIVDRHGIVLRSTRAADGSRHRWIALEEMDPDLLAAFVAAEDRRFYGHRGIDWRGAARAGADNLRAGRVVSGASTITMQLARLVRPVPRTWTGKLRQALWALRLERHLGKQEILEQYLNRIPLGQGAIGVEAAASLYFGGSAADVSLGQAALLAGIARSPSAWSPFTSPARALRARDRVLARLEAAGYAHPDAAARARLEPAVAGSAAGRFLAPHFTTRLLASDDARGDTVGDDTGGGHTRGDDAGGSSAGGSYAGAATAGGVVRSSLDAVLQAQVEGEVRHTAEQLAARGGRHAAAVVLDNATGEVLAWVGSPDFWSDTAGQVDMVTGLRQPGSTLKPFLYALAFDRNFTAATVLPDLPRVFQTASGPYAPRNYDRRFRGPVRMREALASSYNVPAVDLADRIGPSALLETLRSAGFASLTRSADHYGLGLALGNGEVSLVELANGYRALAAGGVWRPWRARAGPEATPPGRRFASARSAALVLDILADPVARIPGFGVGSALELPFPMAAKTGTSRHFTDNWAVGVTERFTVAVWVGSFDGTAMDGVSGVTGAGPLLHRVALATARRYDPGSLPAPAAAGLEPARVCRLSGLLATEDCASLDEWFVPGTVPQRIDDWQRDGGLALPAEYAEWLASTGATAALGGGRAERGTLRASSAGGGIGGGAAGDGGQGDGGGSAADGGAPAGGVAGGDRAGGSVRGLPGRLGEGIPAPAGLRIVSPRDGDRYRVPPGVDRRYATVALRAAGTNGAEVRWLVNGVPVNGRRWRVTAGTHRLVAEAGGRRDSVTVTAE